MGSSFQFYIRCHVRNSYGYTPWSIKTLIVPKMYKPTTLPQNNTIKFKVSVRILMFVFSKALHFLTESIFCHLASTTSLKMRDKPWNLIKEGIYCVYRKKQDREIIYKIHYVLLISYQRRLKKFFNKDIFYNLTNPNLGLLSAFSISYLNMEIHYAFIGNCMCVGR